MSLRLGEGSDALMEDAHLLRSANGDMVLPAEHADTEYKASDQAKTVITASWTCEILLMLLCHIVV